MNEHLAARAVEALERIAAALEHMSGTPIALDGTGPGKPPPPPPPSDGE